jgi:hypothetical protein
MNFSEPLLRTSCRFFFCIMVFANATRQKRPHGIDTTANFDGADINGCKSLSV